MLSDDSLPAALHRIPRAPGCLPVLGHIPRLVAGPLHFLQSLTNIGDVVAVYLGRTPAYVITNPQLVHKMLVTESESFRKGVHYEKLSKLLGESLSTVSGEVHRER